MLSEGFRSFDLTRVLWDRVIDACVQSGPNQLREEYERASAASRLSSADYPPPPHLPHAAAAPPAPPPDDDGDNDDNGGGGAMGT
jgi:hypothetical protein